jgi:hypothetical protein
MIDPSKSYDQDQTGPAPQLRDLAVLFLLDSPARRRTHLTSVEECTAPAIVMPVVIFRDMSENRPHAPSNPLLSWGTPITRRIEMHIAAGEMSLEATAGPPVSKGPGEDKRETRARDALPRGTGTASCRPLPLPGRRYHRSRDGASVFTDLPPHFTPWREGRLNRVQIDRGPGVAEPRHSACRRPGVSGGMPRRKEPRRR